MFENDKPSLEKCSDKESIDLFLELLLTTNPGEHKFDPDFGCYIWDLDFANVTSRVKWKEQFIQYIQEAVERYEPRITQVKVDVNFIDTRDEIEHMGATSIRKRADIKIDATICNTGVQCCFYYSLFLGPLSVD